jgi:short subunit dehydrogenase-like uncharacterized protein
MSARFQIVIFGASGYTGKYAIREAAKVLTNYRWAVAGRNREKLAKNLLDVGKKLSKDLSNIPIIIADINDDNSLIEMTRQAEVIVNCCGPYRFMGEPVVKACIETSTSHVDVSGEPEYMESIQFKYHDAAKKKGIYIVSACGYDSIPSDMGVIYLQKHFEGTVNSIETYLNRWFIDNCKPSGAGVHFATFESAVHGFVHADDLRALRKKLFKNPLPKLQPRLEDKGRLHRADDVSKKWCLSVPTADHSVIMRSQRHFYENDKQRPVQLRTYHAHESLLTALKIIMTGMIFTMLTKYEFGRKLLLNNPKFFTNGFASHEGPTEEYNENSVFELVFVAKGWSKKLENATTTMPINKKMMTRVVCKNPLYGSAALAALLSAATIIDENDTMPGEGGVLSPGAAFRDTNLIDRLHEHGIKFQVLKDEEIIKSKL